MPRLLLVEDNPLLLRLYRALLEEGGHQVRATGCVAGAMIALGTGAPEVLVMDLRLPERMWGRSPTCPFQKSKKTEKTGDSLRVSP